MRDCLRIIPARAGQTHSSDGSSSVSSDHPRACGANLLPNADAGLASGSSPRVRGKRPQKRREPTQNRIIPARAGQTRRSSRTCRTRTDHPRACGANIRLSKDANGQYGSSPRVRGKLRGRAQIALVGRIIPARAGQTVFVYKGTTPNPDHPRACGANAASRKTSAWTAGSSPRVRGKLSRPP